ncbi:MAG: ABC transporter permease [Deferribacterota bacterium]|nr:ABC transporter permease [Deferribacterota bacterium]
MKKKYIFLSVSLLIIIFFIALSLFAPFISLYDPNKINLNNILLPPSQKHIFGTDELGRDVFSRVLYGGRVSLLVSFTAVFISVTIGTIFGLVAGYFGRLLEAFIMRFVDIMLCFPAFFLILAVIAFLEPSAFNVMVVIGLTSWMGVTRFVAAETKSIKNRDFIISAKVSGLPTPTIIIKYILPNIYSPIFVSAVLGISSAIIVESSLSFLGLGVQPPTPSWGNILSSGKDYIMFAWWLSLFPGLAIFATVLSFNMLGEALRDILDPKK